MKHLWPILFVLLVISACEGSDLPERPDRGKDSDNNNSEEAVKIGFHPQDKRNGNIFELIEFNLYSDKDFTFLDLTQAYDSIIWTVSTLDGKLRILDHTYNQAQFKWKWSHNFFLPGEYPTFLHSYKNNEIVYSDTIVISISDKKDFLGYNWKDITESSKGGVGYHNALSDEYLLSTSHTLKEGFPSISFYIFKSHEDEFSISQKKKEFLINYMNSLYSLPTYSLEKVSCMENIYKDIFRNKKEDSQPLYIWVTPKSNIVLLEYHESYGDYYWYEIYGEPNL